MKIYSGVKQFVILENEIFFVYLCSDNQHLLMKTINIDTFKVIDSKKSLVRGSIITKHSNKLNVSLDGLAGSQILDKQFNVIKIFPNTLVNWNEETKKELSITKHGSFLNMHYSITDERRKKSEIKLLPPKGGQYIHWNNNNVIFAKFKELENFWFSLEEFHAINDITGEIVWTFNLRKHINFRGEKISLLNVIGIFEDKIYLAVYGQKRIQEPHIGKSYCFSFNINTGKSEKDIFQKELKLTEIELKKQQQNFIGSQLIFEKKQFCAFIENFYWEMDIETGQIKEVDLTKKYPEKKVQNNFGQFTYHNQKYYFFSEEYIEGTLYADSIYEGKGMYKKEPFNIYKLVEVSSDFKEIKTMILEDLKSIGISSPEFANKHVILLDQEKNLHAYSLEELS